MDARSAFAAYPSAVVYQKPGSRAVKNAVRQLLWGDEVTLTGAQRGRWWEIRVRSVKGEVWVQEKDLQEDRLLEMNFVDIGHGDGCLIVTPQRRRVVVDAGERDNMFRFLRWRFGKSRRFSEDVHFEAFVITHPDKDHYAGFGRLVGHPRVHVRALYHNGIVDREDSQQLGPRVSIRGVDCLDGVVEDLVSLGKLLEREKQVDSRKPYPSLLRRAMESGRVGDIRMLSKKDRYLPGFGEGSDLVIQVLAPVRERGGRLRCFGSDGKTKNGHSVVLRLIYRNISVLLGGDLNIPAENHLLQHYTGIDPRVASADERELLLAASRRVFQSDVAKACHHGSPDFSTLFLRAVNPIATVISSGDDESYAHPRPDALGCFGRHGRGGRPLIFSTELARSGRETIKEPYRLKREISELRDEERYGKTASIRERAKNKLSKLLEQTIERSVAVYGMITLRTDGERVVIAQQLGRQKRNQRWDIHRLEPGPWGLAYQSKHYGGGKKMRDVSKRIFLDGLQCTAKAWYARRVPREAPTETERFRLEQGLEVGRLARELYPQGIEITGVETARAVEETARLIADRTVDVLFEATFQDGDCVARADILVRVRVGWKLIEVKSSKNPADKKMPSKLRELVDDVSYTAEVASRAGLKIVASALLLISPSYRRSMPVEKLFVERDVTEELKARRQDYRELWSAFAKATSGKKRPTPRLCRACNDCEYFAERCIGKGVDHPVTDLPRITASLKMLERLAELETPSIESIPADVAAKLSGPQKRVRTAVLSGEVWRSRSLEDELGTLVWPVYYLDFETIQTAVPIYSDVAPWEQVLTQYSIHHRLAPGAKVEHLEPFLAQFDHDCQEELLTRLLRTLGHQGSIVVYHNFEKVQLEGLKKRFPDYSERIDAVIARLVDLEKLIRNHYYHPEFRGNTSIKRVLPVLDPNLSYKGLSIQNGEEAIVAFARAAAGGYTESELATIRQDLLEYCKLDTLAMVRIHEALL